MKVIHSEHFDIQRKIVANMTTESWETIPHVGYVYEPDVTAFMAEYEKLKEKTNGKVTINTLVLKVLTEGLKAAPVLNGHIFFKRHLVKGEIIHYEDINISMPMLLPDGKMMTINLHDFHNKTLTQMADYIADVRRRMEKTNLTEAMFEVSMANTLEALKKLKLRTVICRLIGAKLGKHRVRTLTGKARKEYYSIPESDRLTYRDIEQGTVTISNLGSIYKNQRGFSTLLEIIPPQICAISIGAVWEKPIVKTLENGEKEIAIAKILPFNMAFDHRAADFGEVVPFFEKLDEIFEHPEIMNEWI